MDADEALDTALPCSPKNKHAGLTSQPKARTVDVSVGLDAVDQPVDGAQPPLLVIGAVTTNIEVLAQRLFSSEEANKSQGPGAASTPRRNTHTFRDGGQRLSEDSEPLSRSRVQSHESACRANTDLPQRPWRLSQAGLHSLWEVLEQSNSLHVTDLPDFHEFLLRRYVRSTR